MLLIKIDNIIKFYGKTDWVYDASSFYHSMGGYYIEGTGGNGSQSTGDESEKGGNWVFEIEGINLKSHFNLDDSIGTSEGTVDKIYFTGGGSGRVEDVGGRMWGEWRVPDAEWRILEKITQVVEEVLIPVMDPEL